MSLKITTINIPDSYLKSFETLIKKGIYNSRSQIVREALKDFLVKEQQFAKDLDEGKFIPI